MMQFSQVCVLGWNTCLFLELNDPNNFMKGVKKLDFLLSILPSYPTLWLILVFF